ncbi:hypothetical protein GIB67_001309 [Kingdonia uniflora]|uniref:Carbohydrate-binding-like fold protein n=1 Tax=Kingdonia uniflora TaxID=39325 RepID=A0A7J7LL25_9MAGN|nr:hypothetical protein GIB67_001309 [Kingdonia uniflora]
MGERKFPYVTAGTYELLPYYKGENTIFDVSPSSMPISVEHRHVKVSQKFQVTGFSVGGRVINENGEGVDGVKIILDGHERSITDRQGYYKLDQVERFISRCFRSGRRKKEITLTIFQNLKRLIAGERKKREMGFRDKAKNDRKVTSKRYRIVAEKAHYKFSSLENFLVLPNMASVADIKAVYYDICGVVHMVSAGYKAKVALTHGPENVKPQVKQTDDTGKFCFEVPPGEYRLSALAAIADSAPGLLFMPSHLDVAVNSPLLNIEFSQAQVNIHGTVLCKEKCGPSIIVEFTRLSGKPVERKTLSLTDESSDFIFPKVLPGKYKLEVKHKPSSDTSLEDKWCWKQSTMDLDVGTKDLEGITFVQKGYWITIISSHDSDAYVRQPDESIMNLQIKKGTQRICLEYPGMHELHFLNSCISFGSLSVKFDTLNPSPIYLKGEKYILIGQVHVDESLHQSINELPESIVVDILATDGAVIDAKPTRVVSGGNNISGVSVYEYSVWVNLGDELTFVPQDTRKGEEKKILFYPRQRQVSVTIDGCQATIPPFSGRLGLYIEGSVSPPLSGVDIKVVAAAESKNALLREGELALETATGLDGFFIGGPLYDDTDYKIDASKPGYHLKPVGPATFSFQKLSQITVQIYSGEKSVELFPSVLLSLSGEDGYRNNTVTGVGGYFVFDGLFPGSFYLRPLLKEYSFLPSAQAIELASGESKEVVFQATRVAYSAMGTVSLLSGLPMEGISIEARAESKGYYEEARTDSSGSYRLRGLLPDTTYLIRVVEKGNLLSTRIERASPEVVSVRVGIEDIIFLDFVVFEQPELTILSGHVEGDKLDKLQSHLLVEVKSASDPSKLESVFPLPLSHFFQIRDLPKGKHLVQLRYSLPSSTHKFESETIEVDLEKQAQIHIGQLKYKVEENHHKQELTPAPVFPLIVGVAVIALFISMPRLKDLYQLGIASSGSMSTLKKEVRKSSVRKKTY